MKNLFDKIFKKEPQFNYIIAEYQPTKISLSTVDSSSSEYDVDAPISNDEMQIDRIYQQQ
jgi:K+-transporting ATPase c subunit